MEKRREANRFTVVPDTGGEACTRLIRGATVQNFAFTLVKDTGEEFYG